MCWAADLYDPIIYCDSLTTVEQIEGKSGCRAETLVPLLATVKELQAVFRFRINHVPRKYVHEADKLAKDFLDQLYK